MEKKILIHPNGKIPLVLYRNKMVTKPIFIELKKINQWILVNSFWNDDNYWVDSGNWVD
ncbi:MAG: hypothetical protein ACOC2W_04320 [bacterium]